MAKPPANPQSLERRARPAHLPLGRWLGDFEPLSNAEMTLVFASARGVPWRPDGWEVNTGKRPETAGEAYHIRAELIRFLLLGGDSLHPVHERGVMLCGAWVTGELDLSHARCTARLGVLRCHFEQVPEFTASILPALVMSGSAVPGIAADGLIVNGSVFLDDGFEAKGEVRLLGANIGGSLVCNGGTFTKADGYVLNMQGINLNGSFFLRRAKFNGAINLAMAKIANLDDEPSCWTSGGHVLNGFHYERTSGPNDAATRIEWLKKQRADQLYEDFASQPWEQLIKVLRDMGHQHDAGVVAIAKQKALREAGKIKGWLRNPLHWIYGKLAGYGYRPMRTVGCMAAVWLVMSFVHWAGADYYAAIGPANPVLTSEALYPEAGELCGHGNETGKARWTECAGVPDEYSTFQPFIYSLDLILPLVDLQQEADWAPIAEGPTGQDLIAGVVLRWLMWFEILFGWTASLILVAVLGRLVEKD